MVDPMYRDANDPGAAIDEIYEDAGEALFLGFNKPTVEKDYVVDKWGTLLSGFAPIKDLKGKIIGIVGVDMSANTVIEKQEFIGNTIYLIMGIAVIIAGIFIFIFSKTIIKDIHKLNRIATDISMGKMDVEMNVSRNDEIGELAESFGRMVASLKIMMMK
jgi:adenylate cyclase